MVGWCHLAMLLHHSRVSKFTVFIYAIKLMTRHESILFTCGSSCVKWQLSGQGALAWTFQFDLHFCSKILANLTANWKTGGLTKPDNKIINHYGNWVILHTPSHSCQVDMKRKFSSPQTRLNVATLAATIIRQTGLSILGRAISLGERYLKSN